MRATAASDANIVGAIVTRGVNESFAAANDALGLCASDAIAGGASVSSLQVHVRISINGGVSACDLLAEDAGESLARCVCGALRGQTFPRPLGPPAMGIQIPPGHEADYLIADATTTYSLTEIP